MNRINLVGFCSADALKLSEWCVEVLAYETISESVRLAQQFGPCDAFASSEWAKGKLPIDFVDDHEAIESNNDWDTLREMVRSIGMRNAYLNAFSPTRKIARLLGCYPEMSPATKNVFTKHLDDNSEMMIISPALVKMLKKSGVWDKAIHKQIRYFEGELAAINEIPATIKEVFSTAYMIDSNVIIDSAARWQRWIDQSQSLRLFLGSPNLRMLSEMFISAWKKGIKGIYEVKSAGFFASSITFEQPTNSNEPDGFGRTKAQDSADIMMKVLSKLQGDIQKQNR